MPAIDDWSEDEDQPARPGGGSFGGGGGNATQAQSTPQREAAFVPWSKFVGANEEVSQREAGKLDSQVRGGIDAANKGREDASSAFGEAVESQYEHGGPTQATGSVRAQAPDVAFGSPTSAASAFGTRKAATAPKPVSTAPISRQQMAMGGSQTVAEAPRPQVMAPARHETRTGLTQGAVAGPKNLEQMMGADPWAKLMGQTGKAQAESAALGSQTGVQALLQQNGPSPDSAFDAALIGGAGRKQFGETAKAGEGLDDSLTAANTGAQDAWHRLMGDIEGRDRDAKATAEADAFNAQSGKDQQSRDADAAANRKELETARTNFANGIAAYSVASRSPGGEQGAVNGLGTSKQFIDALKSGAQYGDGVKWENTPGVQEQMDAASKALGLSPDALAKYFERMSSAEWLDFWLLGVVPPWMEGATTFGYGKPGGWKSPYLENVANYGDDGGMWNAIKNMWTDSAKIIAEGVASPGGAVASAGKAVTYKGPGAGRKA